MNVPANDITEPSFECHNEISYGKSQKRKLQGGALLLVIVAVTMITAWTTVEEGKEIHKDVAPKTKVVNGVWQEEKSYYESKIKELEAQLMAEQRHDSSDVFCVSSSSSAPGLTHRKSWCPEAMDCFSNSFCNTCQRRFLMILTNGRSASTTLMWMMGLLPGVRMGGENNNALENIQEMLDKTRSGHFSDPKIYSNKFSPWFHYPIPKGSFACVAQQMVEATIPPPPKTEATVVKTTNNKTISEENTIIGFKNIRLIGNNADPKELQKLADFLISHFPCTRYIINYRSDIKKQAESQSEHFFGGRRNETKVSQDLQNQQSRFFQLANLLGEERAKMIDSSSWTKNVEELSEVVRWLGFEKCEFDQVMELNKNGYGHSATQTRVDPQCHYAGE